MLKYSSTDAAFVAATAAAATVAAYWHAMKPAFAVHFSNKRTSQRLDRSPT